MTAGRQAVSPRVRAQILARWATESGAAIARRYKLPVSTVRSIAWRAGLTPKQPGRPRKEER